MSRKDKKYSESEILKGIRTNNRNVLNHIYKEYYISVHKLVLKNSGNEQLAWDVFQDAILITYDKIIADRLYLTSSFKTFFISICKNLWYKYLRDQHQKEADVLQLDDLIPSDYDENELIKDHKDNILFRLFRKNLEKLSPECQELLNLLAEGYSGEEIANKTKYASVQVIYNKKAKCIKHLLEKIKSDQDYKNNFGKTDEKI